MLTGAFKLQKRQNEVDKDNNKKLEIRKIINGK